MALLRLRSCKAKLMLNKASGGELCGVAGAQLSLCSSLGSSQQPLVGTQKWCSSHFGTVHTACRTAVVCMLWGCPDCHPCDTLRCREGTGATTRHPSILCGAGLGLNPTAQHSSGVPKCRGWSQGAPTKGRAES